MAETTVKRRRGETRAGLRAIKSKIELRGLAAIDLRSNAARALERWRVELTEALGGEESISPQKATLVDLACRSRLLLDHADAFILAMPTCINKRKKSMFPLVMQRMQIAESLQKTLERLGIERQAMNILTLEQHIEKTYGDKKDETIDGDTQTDNH